LTLVYFCVHSFRPQFPQEGVMRVTIEHRKQAVGLTGKNRRYFVDCTVDLSQEERAIVENRGLQPYALFISFHRV